MYTYLKNMAGFTHSQLKNKSFNEVQKAYDKTMDDDQEEAEMKKHMEIVVDEEEIAVDAIPLATKPPIINIDKEDLETLYKLVKAKHGLTRLLEGYERVLWGYLKVMFKPYVESKLWRNLKGHKVTVWKAIFLKWEYSCRIQKSTYIFMLVEKNILLHLQQSHKCSTRSFKLTIGMKCAKLKTKQLKNLGRV
ncbi:hypothetical protein Tco_0270471 [Tanacetum coccineum]